MKSISLLGSEASSLLPAFLASQFTLDSADAPSAPSQGVFNFFNFNFLVG
jgi:hypothetical protein